MNHHLGQSQCCQTVGVGVRSSFVKPLEKSTILGMI